MRKGKTLGGMVFLPRKKIGVERTWGRNDTVGRAKEIQADEWGGLDDTLGALTPATKDAMYKGGAEGSGTDDIDINLCARAATRDAHSETQTRNSQRETKQRGVPQAQT